MEGGIPLVSLIAEKARDRKAEAPCIKLLSNRLRLASQVMRGSRVRTMGRRINNIFILIQMEEDYVASVAVDPVSGRITRKSFTPLAQDSEASLTPPPKTKKIHHMTLKALQRKKNINNPLPANQKKPKRKYVRKVFPKKETLPQKKQQKPTHFKLQVKKKGRKKKVEPLSEVSLIEKKITKPKEVTYENYVKYFDQIMVPVKQVGFPMIFNREDPKYNDLLRKLNL